MVRFIVFCALIAFSNAAPWEFNSNNPNRADPNFPGWYPQMQSQNNLNSPPMQYSSNNQFNSPYGPRPTAAYPESLTANIMAHQNPPLNRKEAAVAAFYRNQNMNTPNKNAQLLANTQDVPQVESGNFITINKGGKILKASVKPSFGQWRLTSTTAKPTIATTTEEPTPVPTIPYIYKQGASKAWVKLLRTTTTTSAPTTEFMTSKYPIKIRPKWTRKFIYTTTTEKGEDKIYSSTRMPTLIVNKAFTTTTTSNPRRAPITTHVTTKPSEQTKTTSTIKPQSLSKKMTLPSLELLSTTKSTITTTPTVNIELSTIKKEVITSTSIIEDTKELDTTKTTQASFETTSPTSTPLPTAIPSTTTKTPSTTTKSSTVTTALPSTTTVLPSTTTIVLPAATAFPSITASPSSTTIAESISSTTDVVSSTVITSSTELLTTIRPEESSSKTEIAIKSAINKKNARPYSFKTYKPVTMPKADISKPMDSLEASIQKKNASTTTEVLNKVNKSLETSDSTESTKEPLTDAQLKQALDKILPNVELLSAIKDVVSKFRQSLDHSGVQEDVRTMGNQIESTLGDLKEGINRSWVAVRQSAENAVKEANLPITTRENPITTTIASTLEIISPNNSNVIRKVTDLNNTLPKSISNSSVSPAAVSAIQVVRESEAELKRRLHRPIYVDHPSKETLSTRSHDTNPTTQLNNNSNGSF
uniref:Flocculation protein FLO11-like n=1 Tax=Rhabditophanes sp. KR3021 TaxID=114890 RepID=A0AC35UH01_9BILA